MSRDGGDGLVSARRPRQRIESIVQVRDVRTARRGHAPALEVCVVDGVGEFRLVFLGRRTLPGMVVGAWLEVAGVLLREPAQQPRDPSEAESLAMWNPAYRFIPPPEEVGAPRTD